MTEKELLYSAFRYHVKRVNIYRPVEITEEEIYELWLSDKRENRKRFKNNLIGNFIWKLRFNYRLLRLFNYRTLGIKR